jgi:hypothetical protein
MKNSNEFFNSSTRFDEDIIRLWLHEKLPDEAFYYLMMEVSPQKEHWRKALQPQASKYGVNMKLVGIVLFAIAVSITIVANYLTTR